MNKLIIKTTTRSCFHSSINLCFPKSAMGSILLGLCVCIVFSSPFLPSKFCCFVFGLFVCLFVCLIVLAVDVRSTLEVCWCCRRRCQVFRRRRQVFVVVVDLCFISHHPLLRFFGCAAPESSFLDIQLLWVCSSCSQSEILNHRERKRERVLGLQLADIKSGFCFFHLVWSLWWSIMLTTRRTRSELCLIVHPFIHVSFSALVDCGGSRSSPGDELFGQLTNVENNNSNHQQAGLRSIALQKP